jgi:hypothetical protein
MATCRFIAGDPGEIHEKGEAIFCGKPVAREGEAWCAEHRALCYLNPAKLANRQTADMKNAA